MNRSLMPIWKGARMATKTRLLELLESREGTLSGEEAAALLGISRAAVWKAANALRAQGCAIQSVPGRGYILPPGEDYLSEDALLAQYGGAAPPVRYFDEVDSTNLAAKRWAIDGAPHGSLVVAQRQTLGRGRLGRRFESPPGGMYLSVVLRPKGQLQSPGLVTSAAAVASCRAVQALCGLSLQIKWVNDLYFKGRKCCGILTEAATDMEGGGIDYLVTGIGINYTTPDDAFPEELRGILTALYPAKRPPVPRAALAAAVHRQLLALYGALPSNHFLDEYRARSMVLGRRVTVLAPQPYAATALSITNEAHLVVRLPGGQTRELSNGEISVRLEE